EEHLLTMFREDFEFSDEAGASHHAAHSPKAMVAKTASGETAPEPEAETVTVTEPASDSALWTDEATRELKKIPFFVRGKARRNTEAFAAEQGLAEIDLETLYDAKAHYAR
ncbi:MAG: ferredoxin:protochlorophyllide reductase (ATP-dependent) subunit B, partial [Pseudomonadota bacterium]